jgi:regulation of enolase protein 1 (concanavalin A-like superfamily)
MKIAFRLFLSIVMVSSIGLVGCATRPDNNSPPIVEKKSSAIRGWGNVVDIDGDCTVQGDKEKLTITVPDTLHSLSSSISVNAPRVLQEVDGDFTATVRVSGEFVPGEKATKPSGYPFNGAGLLIWGDQGNFIRLERNVWWMADQQVHASYTPLFQYFKAGEEQQNVCPPGTSKEFFQGRSTCFRLERKGDHVTAWYSHDGKEWTAVKEIAVDLPQKVQVGVAAINSSNKAFTVEFTDLKIVAAKPK